MPGRLPFVTAGETNTGISDFIGNEVNVFPANTFTIDMFGSAKYRNYEYGGDDHVAIINTEYLNKLAVLYVAAATNRSANNGKFNYSRNFYAKDADYLLISLPTKDGKTPDYNFMEMFILAIEKIVIKDFVDFADRRIKAMRSLVEV